MRCFPYAFDAYWLPRSAWRMRPWAGRCWTAEFYFRHVGDWRDDPGGAPDAAASRPFYRVLKANWRLEHVGGRFVIRRYELVTARNILPI